MNLALIHPKHLRLSSIGWHVRPMGLTVYLPRVHIMVKLFKIKKNQKCGNNYEAIFNDIYY